MDSVYGFPAVQERDYCTASEMITQLHDKRIYLTYVHFPLKLKKVACLIQDVVSPHTVVIKEWRNVA